VLRASFKLAKGLDLQVLIFKLIQRFLTCLTTLYLYLMKLYKHAKLALL